MEKWTPKMVASRLEEAANTLRRLPMAGVTPAEYGSTWPDVIHDAMEAYGWDAATIRLGPPSAEAISRMDEAMEWFRWLDDKDQVRLVWLRAVGAPWKVITFRYACDRTTAWRKWNIAILTIMSKLNGKNYRYINHGGKLLHMPCAT
ncbi:MAG: helix-turn-helix domain-containing protein [Magnetococcales bacterium]|nr:helix-turn-helix domain-containing protein [Magnetococcales bacterium]